MTTDRVEEKKGNETRSKADCTVLAAPLSGIVVPITDVPDPTFSERMLGDGIAIDPISEILLAPCDGTITQLHKASHALTLTTPNGIEILMHIGLETVLLKGNGFTPMVKEGDKVRRGDKLIAFDQGYLVENAASLLTLIVVSGGGQIVFSHEPFSIVEAGNQTLMELVSDNAARRDCPTTGEAIESDPILILNPAGIHARPAAMLVNSAKQFNASIRILKNGREANAKSVVSVMSLEVENSDKIILKAIGNDAEAAIAKLLPLIKSGLGENLTGSKPKPRVAPPVAPPRPVSINPNLLLGVSASPGLVTGHIFQMRHAEVEVNEKGGSEDGERTALLKAIADAKQEVTELQEDLKKQDDDTKATIFAAHLELLEDPELIAEAQEIIRQGKSAAYAWKTAYTNQADMLSKLNNELLAGRANDIRDIGRRVLCQLAACEAKPVDLPANVILLAENLTPSDTAELDKTKVRGFCTTGGSATSHVSILARSADIPAIAAIEERALDIPNGTMVILDGDKGELRLNPSKEEIDRIHKVQEETARRKSRELSDARLPATTTDQHHIKVVANIGGPIEAKEIPNLGGDGVGLLRSEFLFLQRTEAPTQDEQSAVYATIAKTLGKDRDLVVRTLDVGGDKPLAYLPMPEEENPFLGIRGIRLNLVDMSLLTHQVRAVLAAAPFSNLHIMFPMVATVEEFREARDVVLAEKKALGITQDVKIGVMVEVPSAAVLAENLAREADFFSIGTNDLTQYALAADRGHPRLAKLNDALHPAVLTLIAQTVQGAHKHGRWVGVCGGLASEVLAVPVLLGLGVDELSVSVSAIPAIKAAVRRQSLSKCRALAGETLSMLTVKEVRDRLAKFQEENG